MTDLRELYQEVILEHNKNPRNFNEMCDCSHKAHGDNPLCGDTYDVFVEMDGDLVKKVTFTGHGCAISKAAASMMTSRIPGLTLDEAHLLIDAFRHMLTSGCTPEERKRLGHLRVFEGVAKLPERIKCAVLPWHVLAAALDGNDYVSTQDDL